MILALALVTVAGCDVNNDTMNDQVTLEYNGQEIEKTAKDAARAAEGVATSVGNVAADTGRAIGNEVGDIDVDVDVSRNKADDGK